MPLKRLLRVTIAVFSLACTLLFCAAAQAVPVTGRVLEPDGKPVPGAELVALLPGGSEFITAKSDVAGRFLVEIPVWADRVGFMANVTAIGPDLALGISTWRGRLTTADAYDIRLHSPATISGLVQGEDEKPVAGAVVRLNSLSLKSADPGQRFFRVGETFEPQLTTRTDAAGRWTLPAATGATAIEVALNDPRYEGSTIVATMDVPAGEAIIEARPAATIEGKLVFADGKPAAGIVVIAQGERRASNYAGNKTVAGADGSFRIAGLPPGKYQVFTEDAAKRLVSVAIESVQVGEGAVVKTPEIVMTPGAIVQGTVTDEGTGLPMAGIRIAYPGPHRPGPRAPVTTTDAAGKYSARVATGKSSVFVVGPPFGYLWSTEGQRNVDQLDLAVGETKTVDFRLRRGPTVSGIMVDETGRPAVGATLKLIWRGKVVKGRKYPVLVQPDAAGRWFTDELLEGEYDVSADDLWQVIEPRTIRVPATGEVRVRLRRKNLPSLRGRVVDVTGQALAGVVITPRVVIPAPELEAMFGPQPRYMADVTTDAAGTFQVVDIVPNNSVTLVAAKPGYAYVRGGQTALKEGEYSSTDIAMVPLTARLEGNVLDGAGAPAAGVKVFSPDGDPDTVAVTDAVGKFVLTKLPAMPNGEVAVIAARGNDVATAKVKIGAAVTLTLQPRPELPGRDLGRALQLFTLAKIAAIGKDGEQSSSPPDASLLALHSPDAALQAGADFYGNIPDKVLLRVIARLVRHDPTRASLWVPAKLPTIRDPKQRLIATLNLGSAIAKTDIDLAATLYKQARKLLSEVNVPPDEKPSYQLPLWIMAHHLNLPAAAEHRASIVASLANEKEADELGYYAEHVATIDPALAQEILERIPAAKRGEFYPDVIGTLFKSQPAPALRLLEQLDKLSPKPGEGYFPEAVSKIIDMLGKTDPAAALALAQRVREPGERAKVLAQVARYQPKDVAIALLEEAFVLVDSYSQVSRTHIAAMAYELDAATGLKMFAATKPRPDAGVAFIAQWAFHYQRVDAGAMRILLEQQFARVRDRLRQNDLPFEVFSTISAMVAVDFERACEMSAAVPPGRGNLLLAHSKVDSLMGLMKYALATRQERQMLDSGKEWDDDEWEDFDD